MLRTMCFSNICTFQTIGEDPVFNTSFTHTMTVSKTKSHFSKKKIGISVEEGFLMSRSFMIIFMVSADIHG